MDGEFQDIVDSLPEKPPIKIDRRIAPPGTHVSGYREHTRESMSDSSFDHYTPRYRASAIATEKEIRQANCS